MRTKHKRERTIPNEQSTSYALRNDSNYDMKINPAEITNHKK
jgi:hypothetical protein